MIYNSKVHSGSETALYPSHRTGTLGHEGQPKANLVEADRRMRKGNRLSNIPVAVVLPCACSFSLLAQQLHAEEMLLVCLGLSLGRYC